MDRRAQGGQHAPMLKLLVQLQAARIKERFERTWAIRTCGP